MTFLQFFKSIKHYLGRIFFFPGNFIRKKKKEEEKFLHTHWDRRYKRAQLCGETCPHTPFTGELLYYPVNRSSVPFGNSLSLAKTLVKGTDVAKIIPACLLSCFIFKGRMRERERENETEKRDQPLL